MLEICKVDFVNLSYISQYYLLLSFGRKENLNMQLVTCDVITSNKVFCIVFTHFMIFMRYFIIIFYYFDAFYDNITKRVLCIMRIYKEIF